jgi:hypothetical protein
MATWSLVSTCPITLATASVLTDPNDGVTVFSLRGGWRVKATAAGITISRATTFGGTQAAPVFPITLQQARELHAALLFVTT